MSGIPDILGYPTPDDFQNWIGSRNGKMSGSRRVSSTRWALSSCHHHHHSCSIHLLIPSLLGHTTITTASTVVIIIVVMFVIVITIIAVSICLSHLSAEPFSDRLSPLSAPDICFQSGSTATPFHPRLQTLYKANSLVSSVPIGISKFLHNKRSYKSLFSDRLSPLGAEPHICFQSGSTATPPAVHCYCPSNVLLFSFDVAATLSVHCPSLLW